MRAFSFITALSASMLALALATKAPAADTAPATIRVTLPADATLTVDGAATKATTATRWFTTPALESGRKYSYTFKATFVRSGKTITVEQKVPVEAGRQSVVALNAGGGSAVLANRNFYYNPEGQPVRNYYFAPSDFVTPAAPANGIVNPAVPSLTGDGYKAYNGGG